MNEPQHQWELVGLNGAWEGLRVALAGEKLFVGREPEHNLTLDDGSVSGSHAHIQVLDGSVWVQDLGSTNGTAVNGEEITRAGVSDGDLVEFGGVAFRLVPAGATPAPLPADAPIPEPESLVDPAPPVAPAAPPPPPPAPSLMPTGAEPAAAIPSLPWLLALLVITAGFAVLLFYWIHLLLRT